MGTLAALQDKERRERKTICSLHPTGLHAGSGISHSKKPISGTVDEGETDVAEYDTTRAKTSDQLDLQKQQQQLPAPQQKQFTPRLNLTSDYDSSNDSPSGSDATIDDNAIADSSSKLSTFHRKASSGNALSGIAKGVGDEHEKEYRCVLCGGRTRLTSVSEKSPVLQSNWPNTAPPPPFVPVLDDYGRYLVDNAVYDLEALATDALLCRINEWDYPIFELYEKVGNAILSKMSYHVFFEAGLLEAFKIPIPEFLNYFRALEQGYRDKPCK